MARKRSCVLRVGAHDFCKIQRLSGKILKILFSTKINYDTVTSTILDFHVNRRCVVIKTSFNIPFNIRLPIVKPYLISIFIIYL